MLKIRQDALCTGQCHQFSCVRAFRILHVAPTEGTKHKKLGKQKGLGSGCSTLSYLQLVVFPSFHSSPLCFLSLEWEENIRSHPFKGDKYICSLCWLTSRNAHGKEKQIRRKQVTMKHSLSVARYSCKSRSTAIARFYPSLFSQIMKTYNHSNTLNASQ